MAKVIYENLKVLLVEDDEMQRQAIYFFLNRKVAEVHIAKDGLEGVELFKAHKPNLVVSDIDMPELNGLEMIKEIKKIDGSVYTILISSINEHSIYEKALDMGVNKFLSKPVNIEILHSHIEKLNHTIGLKQRVKSEHKLLQQYKKIIDSSMLVTKTDPKGFITYANRKFCKVSGFKEEELLKKPHNVIRHPDMNSETFKSLWETIKRKKTWRGTIKNLTKDGGFYVVNATVLPILDDEGNVSEYISIREDITDIFITKEKEKIEREKAHLEKLDKTKESFLVVFTHELKTPLNAIISFSQYVLKKIKKSDIEGKEELIDLLSEVRQNGNDMLESITNILDISRLKNHKLQFNHSNFVLEDLIQTLNSQFAGLILNNGVDVHYKLPNRTKLYCDKNRIKQILSNLISNAIKYGEDTIDVKVSSNEKEFIITVEDNGPGVKNPDKIFGLFEQDEENDLKRTSKGTGVGLHFTKMLCDSFDYTLEVGKSQELGGACFTIRGSCNCEKENNV